uniref:Putative transmembrane protein n=1 Tax=Toxoplasma gondii COUG TaxID=1074873 RepID=A0A2G8XZ89_TOXGO|nr:putative transmembrane protein [Toxoplasma gondii COUG]
MHALPPSESVAPSWRVLPLAAHPSQCPVLPNMYRLSTTFWIFVSSLFVALHLPLRRLLFPQSSRLLFFLVSSRPFVHHLCFSISCSSSSLSSFYSRPSRFAFSVSSGGGATPSGKASESLLFPVGVSTFNVPPVAPLSAFRPALFPAPPARFFVSPIWPLLVLSPTPYTPNLR